MTALKSSINTSPVKLIIIGVGNDVQTDVLKDIASSASKGTYCAASHYYIEVAMNYHQCNNALTYMVMAVISLCLSVCAGIYLFATEDKASITEAFGKVAQLIQEQILIEEY